MDFKYIFNLNDWLIKLGVGEHTAVILNTGFSVIIIILLAYLSDILAKLILVRSVKKLVKHTRTNWDDILLQKKVFHRLSHLAPALVLHFTVGFALSNYPVWVDRIQAVIYIYMLIVGLLTLDSLLSGLHDIYNTLPIAKTRSIKGYVQVIKIILYFITGILILAILFNQKVTWFFAGLGTMAAVLLLVFKDTILGFVASIQLSANDMVRPGDWIEMPSRSADGPVTEITLNTVKVRNWDKTITTIPTYALVSESFTNWRGMEESGGRRIKRHIYIDMKSVKFCTPEMIDKFRKIHYLKDYIDAKRDEIEKFNHENHVDITVLANGRRVTNLGTFRKYVEFYLRNHPQIHDDFTFMVRQLQPTERGLPLEIYAFSKIQSWVEFEGIQADIFDYLIAVIPEFELRLFQAPSGDDVHQAVAAFSQQT